MSTSHAGYCRCNACIGAIGSPFPSEPVIYAPAHNTPFHDEMADGMLQWEPGALSTVTLDRIVSDGLADMWADCWRLGGTQKEQIKRFQERVEREMYAATGIRGWFE